jgi:hypothetical protein
MDRAAGRCCLRFGPVWSGVVMLGFALLGLFFVAVAALKAFWLAR